MSPKALWSDIFSQQCLCVRQCVEHFPRLISLNSHRQLTRWMAKITENSIHEEEQIDSTDPTSTAWNDYDQNIDELISIINLTQR